MLISLKYRFIFVANTKSASTAIEHHLHRCSDIAVRQQANGKHWPADRIAERYCDLFQREGVSFGDFFRFGVVRDPVEWVVSWFNYRSRSGLSRRSPNSTHCISFDDFVDQLCNESDRPSFARFSSQARRFVGLDGSLSVDYVVPYVRISEDFELIVRELQLPVSGKIKKVVKNVSPTRVYAEDVSNLQRRLIENKFRRDKLLYEAALEIDREQLQRTVRTSRLAPHA